MKYDGKDCLEYERDKYGNVVKDDDGNPVVSRINGRIYSRMKELSTWWAFEGDRRNGEKTEVERR